MQNQSYKMNGLTYQIISIGKEYENVTNFINDTFDIKPCEVMFDGNHIILPIKYSISRIISQCVCCKTELKISNFIDVGYHWYFAEARELHFFIKTFGLDIINKRFDTILNLLNTNDIDCDDTPSDFQKYVNMLQIIDETCVNEKMEILMDTIYKEISDCYYDINITDTSVNELYNNMKRLEKTNERIKKYKSKGFKFV